MIAANKVLVYRGFTQRLVQSALASQSQAWANFPVIAAKQAMPMPPSVVTPHFFSTTTIEVKKQTTPGSVTKTLRMLDMNVVKTILEELKSVDTNSDQRIDANELKLLLRKHTNAFTDEEIHQISEEFYAGKAGGSVSFDRFIEAIDRVVQREEKLDDEEGENPLKMGSCGNEFLFYKSHGNYKTEDLNIKLTHTEPVGIRDKFAFNAVKGVRKVFDFATSWNTGVMTQEKVLQRTIFLETIAAVPGMVAAIYRHFRSLRHMTRDGGMIQIMLDEAHNERMHLLTFVRMRNPGYLYRMAVIGGQFAFGSAFMLTYMLSPKFCHRFVGYVEEEACSTYTKIIKTIETAPEGSEMAEWRTDLAPAIARSYWHLGENGTTLDMFYAIRADEAEHRDVNHLCSEFVDKSGVNPVSNTEMHLNTMLLKYVKDIMDKNPEKSTLQQA